MAYCAYCGSHTDVVSLALCASCAKPTNGAPVPVTTAGRNPAAIVGIVIVVAFVGIAVLGILAAIAIPNLLTAMERSKQKRTMADIRTLAVCVETYATQYNKYPRAESISELTPQLVPTYAKTLPHFDGWGNELRYRCSDEECSRYGISSSGKDQVFEHVSASEYEQSGTTNFDCDIVFIDGSFRQYPEGRSN